MSCSPECLAFMEKCYLEEEEKLLEAEIAGEEQDPTPEEARLLETMRKGFMGEIEKLKKENEELKKENKELADAGKGFFTTEILVRSKEALEENLRLKKELEQAEESLENAGYKWIESEGHYSCE